MPNNNVQGLCDGYCADATLSVVCKNMSVPGGQTSRQQAEGNK